MGRIALPSPYAIVCGLVAAILMTIAVNVYPAAAQLNEAAEERLTLTPTSFYYDIAAGDVKSDKFRIINDGNVAYDFVVYARPYSVNNEAYEPNFTDVKQNADAYRWVQFEKTKFHIEPGQIIEVAFSLRIPQDAAPGGHYGVLFAESQPADPNAAVVRKKRIGAVLYTTVEGEYKTEGSFRGFELPFWQTRPPLQSQARIENSGNTDFNAKINTVAKNIFGTTKFTYTSEPVVLPDTIRLVNMNWDKAPSIGLFKVTQSVEFLDQTYGNSKFVLIMPRWVPLSLLAVLVVGVGYAMYSHRKSRR